MRKGCWVSFVAALRPRLLPSHLLQVGHSMSRMSRVCSSYNSLYFFTIIILIPLSLLLKIFGLILILHQESHALRYLGILNIFEQFLAHHSALTGLIRFTSGESDLWPPVAACGLNLAPWIPMRKRCAPCAHPIGDPWGRAREIESLPSLPWFRLFLKIFKGKF